MSTSTVARAMVKAVLSGDSLVLITKPNVFPPPEKDVRVSGIVAPRLGWKDQPDEPFAWESREFLRGHCVGKVVLYRLEGNKSGRHEFAQIMVENHNVSIEMVKLGLAKVRQPGRGAVPSELQELMNFEERARAAGLGVWSNDKDVLARAMRTIPPFPYNHDELMTQWQNRRMEALVEQVRDGSSFRLQILPSHHSVLFFLAGIQCPPIRRAPEGEEQVVAEFALESKSFTEIRLLHRKVEVIVEGIDKFQTFFGQIIHPKGDIRHELLKSGFARVVNWSAMMTAGSEKLRAAETIAKNKRLGVWHDFVPSAAQVLSGTRRGIEFRGRVIDIVSGDFMTVLEVSSGKTQRLSLSSIRCPRSARGSDRGQPWSYEARDYVRNLVGGRIVRAVVDYARPAQEGGEERLHATLFVEGGKSTNVNERLVGAGLASVIRHRADDDRSLYYDGLLKAEAEARQANKGIHSDKDAPVHHIHDLSADRVAAVNFRPYFERDRKLKGIVEYVISGSRLKVFFPKHSCKSVVVLQGVRSPQRGEPFFEESVRFSQMWGIFSEVQVDVEGTDAHGAIVGSVERGSEILAELLIENGLASIHEFSIAKCAHRTILLAAEERGRAERKNMFALDNAEKEPVDSPPRKSYQEVVVSEVLSGIECCTRPVNSSVRSIETEIRSLNLSSNPVSAVTKGQFCGVLFPKEATWYRCRVVSVDGNTAKCLFIDFGNSESVGIERLRPLPPALSPPAHPALAAECSLAYLRAPELDEDYGRETAALFQDVAIDENFIASIEYRDSQNRPAIVLFPKSTPNLSEGSIDAYEESINAMLIKHGLAVLDRSVSTSSSKHVFEKLQIAQDYARSRRACLWEYGELTGSLAEDDDVL